MKELVKVPKVDKIPYFDKHPALGGTLTYLSPEEFKQKFGCEYSESIWCTENFPVADFKKLSFKPHVFIDQDAVQRGVAQLMRAATPKLAIVFMGEALGYAVIALEDIPEDTLVCLYAGECFLQTAASSGDDYIHVLGSGFAVSGQKMRGFSGFMPHLPLDYDCVEKEFTKFMKKKAQGRVPDAEIEAMAKKAITGDRKLDPEFDGIKFSNSKIKESVATTNLHMLRVPINGMFTTAAMTRNRVKQYQLLGFTYGWGYWEGCGITPELFTHTCEVIPHDCYTRSVVVPDQHTALVKSVEQLDPQRKIGILWEAIDRREYGKALRRACTDRNHTMACNLVSVLLRFKKSLHINPNETAGDAKQAAIHYAAKAGNSNLVELLVSNGANRDLVDGSGKTAADLLKVVAENKSVAKLLDTRVGVKVKDTASRAQSQSMRLEKK